MASLPPHGYNEHTKIARGRPRRRDDINDNHRTSHNDPY